VILYHGMVIDGHFSAIKRMYLDSRILQAELARSDIQHEAKHTHAAGITQLARLATIYHDRLLPMLLCYVVYV
jgi:hypothetical protein